MTDSDRQHGQVMAAVNRMHSDISELKGQVGELDEKVDTVSVAITGDHQSPGLREKVNQNTRDVASLRRKASPPKGMPSVSDAALPTGQYPIIQTQPQVSVARWKAIGVIGVALIGLVGTLVTIAVALAK